MNTKKSLGIYYYSMNKCFVIIHETFKDSLRFMQGDSLNIYYFLLII